MKNQQPLLEKSAVGSWQLAVKKGYSVFGIQYSVFGIQYSVFGIQYSVFSIPCLTDCISRQAGVSAN